MYSFHSQITIIFKRLKTFLQLFSYESCTNMNQTYSNNKKIETLCISKAKNQLVRLHIYFGPVHFPPLTVPRDASGPPSNSRFPTMGPHSPRSPYLSLSFTHTYYWGIKGSFSAVCVLRLKEHTPACEYLCFFSYRISGPFEFITLRDVIYVRF